MITEIFVEGRKLDVSADISSLLTFAIDDVKDFSTRSTTFSKTVILPGTANNNAIFGNIFEMGISNDYDPLLNNIGYNFNASKSAKCIIFQDNLQTFKGTLRLLEIDKDKGRIEYQAALNGDLTTLNVALSSGYISDLDFSAYNLLYNVDNITASWDNAPGSGVYFPLIDYGTYSIDKKNWAYNALRPALYVKEFIDKMFAAAGFRYDCDLLNTARFKGLVVPHNQKILYALVSQVLSSSVDSIKNVLDFPAGKFWGSILWDTIVAGGFTYSNGEFTYTQATSLPITLAWKLAGWKYSDDGGAFTITVEKNGVALAETQITVPARFSDQYEWSGSVDTSLVTGDVIRIFYQQGYLGDPGPGTNMQVSIENTTPGYSTFSLGSTTPSLQPVDYNQKISLNDSLPQNVRQVDFLTSIVKLFNLYVYENQFDDRLIIIRPFVDYYTADGSVVVDWTYKMNRDKAIKINPLSELNSKLYNFNYKDDSDYWNDLYKKRYNQGYGSRIFDSQFEFADQTNTLTLEFASTPLVGYVGEEKVYSTIFKRTGEVTGTGEETVDSVIRILQTQKITDVPSWQILRVANDLTTSLGTYTSYGYAGHLDDPDNPGNDLNFGALNELFFILTTGDLSNTQFNVYWSSYMAEITDKDSKLLTANFYLTPKDIFELDFSRYITVDGVLFRLNKITDYNATIPSDCEVQLLKVINTAYSFPPGSEPSDDYAIYWTPGQPLLWSPFLDIAGPQFLYK